MFTKCKYSTICITVHLIQEIRNEYQVTVNMNRLIQNI